MTKIFLAEDDQTMVHLLQTLLNIEGFEVEALDVSQAELLEPLRALHPEVLLIDVNLPNHNGLDIVTQMRKEETFSGTRIIMASGMSLKEKCLEAGADAFLLKPYMPDDLISVIRQYIPA